MKQSNDCNDTGGDANLFSDPTFPTIVVDACAVTISGTVFNDRNENGVPAAHPSRPVRPGTSRSTRRTTSARSIRRKLDDVRQDLQRLVHGLEEQGLRRLRDRARPRSWVQTVPSTTPSPCATGSQEPNGWSLTNVAANQNNKDFGNLAATVTPGACAASRNTQYTVKAGSDSNCKTGTSSVDYIYEKWAEGHRSVRGLPPRAQRGDLQHQLRRRRRRARTSS